MQVENLNGDRAQVREAFSLYESTVHEITYSDLSDAATVVFHQGPP